MRIAVVGAGGVGGYFGGRLAQSGQDVVFMARGAHLQAMRESGLRVESIKGDFTLPRVHAFENPAEIGVVDAVVVGVKGWQAPEIATRLHPLVGPETVVLPLQNGVEAYGQIAAALGTERVIGGSCKIISFVAGPGIIRHTGLEPTVALGEWDNRRSERTERLLAAFQGAGVTCEIPNDIERAIWEKFLFIAPFSAVAAVTRVPAGLIREVPESRELLQRAIREVQQLGRARGVTLDEQSYENVWQYVENLPAEGTASMQRDIMEGRPSELQSLCGAVVRLARESGVATPVHDVLYASLAPQEARARRG